MSGRSSNRSYSSLLRSSTKVNAQKYAKEAMKKAILELCQNYEREFHEPVKIEFARKARGRPISSHHSSSKLSTGLNLKELVDLPSQVLSQNSRSSRAFSPVLSPNKSSSNPQMVDMIRKSSNCIVQTADYLTNYASSLERLMRELNRTTSSLQESLRALEAKRQVSHVGL
mmetsp:Transcript_11075/g.21701  ORF Transcript_11075/g.21701 Transcript_11075/m.21701 type:complete len:171 (-) Transcript_11075:2265-2777(-)